MGHQESFIFSSSDDLEQNRKDIEQLLALFKKYHVRCAGDEDVECTHRLYFNEEVVDSDPIGRLGLDRLSPGLREMFLKMGPLSFPKGMEMLVVCGSSRSRQTDFASLFNGGLEWHQYASDEERRSAAWHKLTREEKDLGKRVNIHPIENLFFICEAEQTDKITVEELNLLSETELTSLDKEVDND